MLELSEHFPFNDLFAIEVLNLPKLATLNNDNLRLWLQFITAKRKEEFMNLATKSPRLAHAVEALETISADRTSRALYEARLKAQRDAWARENDARVAGIEEGEQRGEQRGERKKEKEILRLLHAGYSAGQLLEFLSHKK
jgi:predicted transposase/invertase (TIGR01784 family)